MCVGEHVCVLVVVFVFWGHEHGWFHVRVGHDEVLVVRVLGFSLGVVHMWMWCLGLSVVCCSPYTASHLFVDMKLLFVDMKLASHL